MGIVAQESCRGEAVFLPESSSCGWGVTVEKGVFWLVTPGGEKFYGCGVNGVNAGFSPESVQGRPAYHLWNFYPSVDSWAASMRDQLLKWGFNHLGPWSIAEEKIGLPYIPNLNLGWFTQALWCDPFEPATVARANEWAERLTAPHRQRGLRIGYFPDNEVGWWNAALFTFYLSQGWQNHTKQLLWELLYDRYEGNWQQLLNDWVPPRETQGFNSLKNAGSTLKLRPGGSGIRVLNEFTYRCAARYYKLMHDALRAADPQALIFSDRLPIYYSQAAVRAMAPYVDVVAVNYNLDGPEGWVAHYFFEGLAALADKPILVSEFFCAAMENRSGNKNIGHLLKVPTQAKRAMVVQQALRNFARFPHIVGTQWFQYYDEPQGGRADGEDYNMGLVDMHGQAYEELVAAFQSANLQLPRLHAEADVGRIDARDSSPVSIPRASCAIDVSDGSLTDWDKEKTLMRGFAAESPDVPFADIYLAWDPRGIYLATIGMDYMHPEHVFYEGAFPLSETYQVHLLVFIDYRTYHFAIHFIPREVNFAAADQTNARGSITFIPYLYTHSSDGQPQHLSGAAVQYLNDSAPRISCEARFPAHLFGLPCFTQGMKLKMNIVLLSHYRGHEMFWSEGTAARTFSHPEGWRAVTLG